MATAAGAAGPRREPPSLAVFPEEQRVLDAFASAGLQVNVVGGSKFEGMLGERQRARAFIVRSGPGGLGADVLFLDRPIRDLRVCYSRAESGLKRIEIFVAGVRISSGEGVDHVLMSASDTYLVQAFGQSAHEALMRGLGTAPPPC